MNLQHPETGQHTRASLKTAERLIAEGWKKITAGEAAPAEKKSKTNATKEPAAATSEQTPADGDSAETELPKKLGELVTYAEENHLFDAATIESWRKPGTKTADVRAAIEKKLAEGDGQ